MIILLKLNKKSLEIEPSKERECLYSVLFLNTKHLFSIKVNMPTVIEDRIIEIFIHNISWKLNILKVVNIVQSVEFKKVDIPKIEAYLK
jgi:hypothetical protein